jgi:hypothetical protein
MSLEFWVFGYVRARIKYPSHYRQEGSKTSSNASIKGVVSLCLFLTVTQ